jgi:hypothetical protein
VNRRGFLGLIAALCVAPGVSKDLLAQGPDILLDTAGCGVDLQRVNDVLQEIYSKDAIGLFFDPDPSWDVDVMKELACPS